MAAKSKAKAKAPAKKTAAKVAVKKVVATKAPAKAAAPKKIVAKKDVTPKAAPKSSAAAKAKWVYTFGDGRAEGRAEMRSLLGGKGANLAEMSNLGLPVPPGYTITTEVCTWYYDNGKSYPPGLEAQAAAALAQVEKLVGAKFGDVRNPLLVSVRSGARASMPGMMDTILNLGLNDETVVGLAKQSGNERFAWDSYRRFIQMYSGVVLDVGHEHFEDILEMHKEDKGVSLDTELDAEDWKEVAAKYKKMVQKHLGRPFPQDVHE
ncbi:MAG: PEP/pyruvate-binding domain-containing protein, partial [Ferrovibrionaceae bacterium]